jgi:hypothetical protein
MAFCNVGCDMAPGGGKSCCPTVVNKKNEAIGRLQRKNWRKYGQRENL